MTRRKPATEESDADCAHPSRVFNNGLWFCVECGDPVE